MEQVISTENIPVKLWLSDIEEGALSQAKSLANLPFAFRHIAIMPDSHQGYGMPIGGVMATKNVIVPNAVGVDIGCGMCAVKTSLTEIDIETIKKIMGGSKENKGGIRGNIPVGFNHRKKDQDWCGFDNAPDIPIIQQELKSARKQLGTLGGGNHFIEIQKGSDGHIWFMIHSGSRNFGLKIAKEYNNIAQNLCLKWYSNVPPFKGQDGLAFLPMDSKEGQEYFKAMNYALSFARASRGLMRQKIMGSFYEHIEDINDIEIHDVHHNYARWENHFGQNVIIHRKGATSAREGEIGIIPGSQGTKSYIVKGKGNPESFESCSHGAGRKMSRTKAQNNLDLNEEMKKLNDQNIIHAIRNKKDLDEASGAYKDIKTVMNNQADLVDVEVELTPLAVIKG